MPRAAERVSAALSKGNASSASEGSDNTIEQAYIQTIRTQHYQLPVKFLYTVGKISLYVVAVGVEGHSGRLQTIPGKLEAVNLL